MPIRSAGASPPSAAGATSARSAAAAFRPAGEAILDQVEHRRAADRSPSRSRRPSSLRDLRPSQGKLADAAEQLAQQLLDLLLDGG